MTELKKRLNVFLDHYALEYRIAVVIAIVFLFYIHYSGCN
jgi:hypothetical protein